MVPPAPGDPETLLDVLAEFADAGWTHSFSVEPPDRVRCGPCRIVVEPAQLEVHALRRLEGASDPADMLAVAAVTCAGCDAHGVLVLGYGPDSSPEDAAVLSALDDQRATRDVVVPPRVTGA
jgi:hypothetical protein